jgi:hypothetical protein
MTKKTDFVKDDLPVNMEWFEKGRESARKGEWWDRKPTQAEVGTKTDIEWRRGSRGTNHIDLASTRDEEMAVWAYLWANVHSKTTSK